MVVVVVVVVVALLLLVPENRPVRFNIIRGLFLGKDDDDGDEFEEDEEEAVDEVKVERLVGEDVASVSVEVVVVMVVVEGRFHCLSSLRLEVVEGVVVVWP